MTWLEDQLNTLERLGLADIILPFLLVFTVVYAVLTKTHILGEDRKNFNVVVSLVLAFAVIIPHSTGRYGNFDPVDILNRALPQVSVIAVAVVMVLILIGVFAHDKVFLGVAIPSWITLGSIIAVGWIFLAAAGVLNGGLRGLESWIGEDVVSVAIMLLVFGVIIGFITSGGEDKAGILDKARESLGKVFSGGK